MATTYRFEHGLIKAVAPGRVYEEPADLRRRLPKEQVKVKEHD